MTNKQLYQLPIKEAERELENRELKKYLRYYHLSDIDEMTNEMLDEFVNYMVDVKIKFRLENFIH